MAQVFISFIHEEVGYAEAVKDFISRTLGPPAAPFLSSDRFQVYAGEKWIDRIMDELREAKVVILMLSEESVKRPWVNFEAGAAWTRNIVTIPVCIRRLTKDDLPKPYSSLQAVDLNSVREDEYLACSVAHYLGLAKPSGRMQMPQIGGDLGVSLKYKSDQTAYTSLDATLKLLNREFGVDT
jgi:hypothetical protein